ncbi:hypothetical protein H696_02100 [Fonticula alba]|uniref:Uncharacterized protein n=1 Tax=Fonticula alba TaxID=691883 RepID=A0A058ZA69_FONAL|nr:hypothetical protein H696_02100 [Fonticula alba]KCV71150.1 hypothetical protein H696_02100 [Fonticula alba]|eukprot:XP_009494273.1 hypothetical protein H696_02100 [Fonticula alba]
MAAPPARHLDFGTLARQGRAVDDGLVRLQRLLASAGDPGLASALSSSFMPTDHADAEHPTTPATVATVATGDPAAAVRQVAEHLERSGNEMASELGLARQALARAQLRDPFRAACDLSRELAGWMRTCEQRVVAFGFEAIELPEVLFVDPLTYGAANRAHASKMAQPHAEPGLSATGPASDLSRSQLASSHHGLTAFNRSQLSTSQGPGSLGPNSHLSSSQHVAQDPDRSHLGTSQYGGSGLSSHPPAMASQSHAAAVLGRSQLGTSHGPSASAHSHMAASRQHDVADLSRSHQGPSQCGSSTRGRSHAAGQATLKCEPHATEGPSFQMPSEFLSRSLNGPEQPSLAPAHAATPRSQSFLAASGSIHRPTPGPGPSRPGERPSLTLADLAGPSPPPAGAEEEAAEEARAGAPGSDSLRKVDRPSFSQSMRAGKASASAADSRDRGLHASVGSLSRSLGLSGGPDDHRPRHADASTVSRPPALPVRPPAPGPSRPVTAPSILLESLPASLVSSLSQVALAALLDNSTHELGRSFGQASSSRRASLVSDSGSGLPVVATSNSAAEAAIAVAPSPAPSPAPSRGPSPAPPSPSSLSASFSTSVNRSAATGEGDSLAPAAPLAASAVQTTSLSSSLTTVRTSSARFTFSRSTSENNEARPSAPQASHRVDLQQLGLSEESLLFLQQNMP